MSVFRLRSRDFTTELCDVSVVQSSKRRRRRRPINLGCCNLSPYPYPLISHPALGSLTVIFPAWPSPQRECGFLLSAVRNDRNKKRKQKPESTSGGLSSEELTEDDQLLIQDVLEAHKATTPAVENGATPPVKPQVCA